MYLKTSFSSIKSVFMSLSFLLNHTYDLFCLSTLFIAESYHITRSENFLLHSFGTCRELKDEYQTANDSESKGNFMIHHLNGEGKGLVLLFISMTQREKL